MSSKKGFFWINILWSIVVIFAVALFAYIRYSQSNGIIGFEIYPYVFSPYVIGATIVIYLLSIARVIKNRSFLYTLAGTSNAFLAIAGLYLVFTSQVKVLHPIDLFFAANGLIAVFILIKAYRN